MLSDKEGLRAIFFKEGEKRKGLQVPVHRIIGAGSSAVAAVTWHSGHWVWKLSVGFLDSHCKKLPVRSVLASISVLSLSAASHMAVLQSWIFAYDR